MNDLLQSLWSKHEMLLDCLISIDIRKNRTKFTNFYIEAVENIISIVEFARSVNDNDTIWVACCEMCKINIVNNVDIESAVMYQLISLELARQMQDDKKVAISIWISGNLMLSTNSPEKALERFFKAHDILFKSELEIFPELIESISMAHEYLNQQGRPQ